MIINYDIKTNTVRENLLNILLQDYLVTFFFFFESVYVMCICTLLINLHQLVLLKHTEVHN